MKPISKRDVLTRRVPMKKIHRILSFHGVAVCIRAKIRQKLKFLAVFFKYFCLCVDYSSINMLLFQHIFGQKLSR